MLKSKVFLLFCFLSTYVGTAFGASVILNEYNAVGDSNYLGINGSDQYWGRVAGNGGDWFELAVIEDNLDLRLAKFKIYEEGSLREVLNLTDHSIWFGLRSGTIITVSEVLADDVSYNPIYDPLNPDAGDWWINVHANAATGTGTYIEDQNFPVNNDDWQLLITTVTGETIFGPAGEGVIPGGPLVSKEEIFRLEEDPSSSITPLSNYDDAKNLSTFGSPNRWGNSVQDFSQLRSVIPEPSTLLLLGWGSLALLRKHRP